MEATAKRVTESGAVWSLPERLDLNEEFEQLDAVLAHWLDTSEPEMHVQLRQQLSPRAKHFRPVTVFACHGASTRHAAWPQVLQSAAAIELVHNVSLVIDDILDRSRYRRGELSLHCRFGSLPALMVSGYMTAGAFAIVADDAYAVRVLAELLQRLGVAECAQWRLRRHPLGLEDWRAIAGEDTGSMFEVAARLGTRDDRLRRYGRLLGILYHGCDDVADVRGSAALGGGSEKDISDGILTLPAAIAIRDPETAVLFRRTDAIDALTARLVDALPEAERVLDEIADEARAEALRSADDAGRLLELVSYTRALSEA